MSMHCDECEIDVGPSFVAGGEASETCDLMNARSTINRESDHNAGEARRQRAG